MSSEHNSLFSSPQLTNTRQVDSEITMKEWYRLLDGEEPAAEEERPDPPTPKYIPKPKLVAIAPRPKPPVSTVKSYIPPARKPAIVVVESEPDKEVEEVEGPSEKETEEVLPDEEDESSEVEVEVHKKKKKRTKERAIEPVQEIEIENSPPKKRRRQDSNGNGTEGLAWLEEKRRKKSIESTTAALSRVNSREKAVTPIRGPLISSRHTSRSTQTPGLVFSDVKPGITKIIVVDGEEESESPPSPSPRARPHSQAQDIDPQPVASSPRPSPQPSPRESSPPLEEEMPSPRSEPEASTSHNQDDPVKAEDLEGVDWNGFFSDPAEEDQLSTNRLNSDDMEEDLLQEEAINLEESEEEEEVMVEEDEEELLDIVERIPISGRKELVMVDMKGKGRVSPMDDDDDDDEVEVVRVTGGSKHYTVSFAASRFGKR